MTEFLKTLIIILLLVSNVQHTKIMQNLQKLYYYIKSNTRVTKYDHNIENMSCICEWYHSAYCIQSASNHYFTFLVFDEAIRAIIQWGNITLLNPIGIILPYLV